MAGRAENNSGVFVLGGMHEKTAKNPGTYSVLADDQTACEEANEKRERLRKYFWKNIIIISVAFMMIFIGYYPVSAVQSSLNNEKGLGMAALSAKYSAMAFGNLFTNNYVVDRVGCKWTMGIGMLMYSSYIAANFYPVLFTLVPLGILSGIGGAAMWMAQGTYMTRISNDYVALYNEQLTADGQAAELARIKSRVFAIFNVLFFASNAIGNIASSLILPLGGRSNMTEARLEHCGVAYCNENLDAFTHDNFASHANVTSSLLLSMPSCQTDVVDAPLAPSANVYLLCTFCMTSAIIGVLLIVIFLDRLPSLGVSEKVTNSDSIFKLVLATIRHWKNPYQLLLIPLGLYNGMDSTFWSAEFTKSFVTCAVGIHYVGYVMVCYGFSSPVFIFFFSWFNKSKFRFVPFLVGLVAQLSVMIVILNWTPRSSDDISTLFVLSVVWGIGSGVWYPSTYAFISIMFHENMEAAFSNFHLWNNLGSALTYAWSYGLCVHTKVFLLMGILIVGVICYLSIELHVHITSQRNRIVASDEKLNNCSEVAVQYGSVQKTKTGK